MLQCSQLSAYNRSAIDQPQQSLIDKIWTFPPKPFLLKKILDLKTTGTFHVRTTIKDTLSQAGPPTQGLSNNLDMGWRNASRSISQ
ncbi:hypothetical protein TNCV_2144571 [Trichonephila clavipes]|nr:hypothetical protein TNCV_2144571 [Trichonephila clavipes]